MSDLETLRKTEEHTLSTRLNKGLHKVLTIPTCKEYLQSFIKRYKHRA